MGECERVGRCAICPVRFGSHCRWRIDERAEETDICDLCKNELQIRAHWFNEIGPPRRFQCGRCGRPIIREI